MNPSAIGLPWRGRYSESKVEIILQKVLENSNRRLATVLVVAAAGFSGLAFSAESYINFLLLLLMGVLAAAAINVQTKRHFLGLAALTLSGVVLPFQLRLSNISLNAVIVICAFYCFSWLLRLVVSSERSRIDKSGAVLASIGLIVAALISFVAGQYPWYPAQGAPLSAQLGGLGLYLLSGVLFLAVGHQIGNLSELRQVTWLFLVAGGAFCISQTIPGTGIMDSWSSPDSVGSMFWIWLVAISSSQALFNRSLSKLARTVLICLTALALYRGLFLARDWASGWLPPLIAVAVILSFRFRRTAIGLCFVGIPVTLIIAGQATSLLMSHEQYSYMTRLEAWRVLLQLAWKSPIVGLGIANYYHYTLMYSILGWYVHFCSHNNYVDLLAQTGALGIIAFCWFAAGILGITLSLRRRLPAGFAQAYAIGVLGGLVGSLASGMLADWIIPFVYNIGIRGFRSSFLFWLFLGGILALKRMSLTSGFDSDHVAATQVLLNAPDSRQNEVNSTHPNGIRTAKHDFNSGMGQGYPDEAKSASDKVDTQVSRFLAEVDEICSKTTPNP